MKYRADIDGLRAVAVTSVVLFHAGLWPLKSGFVGVDIFFVISGFLIGGIISREIQDRRFTFVNFYTRRARRILPALLCVLLFTAAAGALLLSPRELANLGGEIASATLGVSNIFYWKITNYFNPTAALNPLLMTWSLGVEEQFYVVLPFVLYAISRLPAGVRIPTLCVICAGCLGLGVYLTRFHATAAFYLLPARAWELGAGTLLALLQAQASPARSEGGWPIQLAAGVGAALVVVSICFLKATGFPGWAAILPVGGAVLLIGSPGSWLNRNILSARPMVFIGKISYSWYLWHWPLMTFVRLSQADDPSVLVLLAVAALSFGLAILSWRFVETPFRHARLPPRRILLSYAGVVAVWLLAPATFVLAKGLPSRLPPVVAGIDAVRDEPPGLGCLAYYGVTELDRRGRCLPPPDGRPTWILLGDSHAAALAPGFAQNAERAGRRLVIMTKSSCPPLQGASRRLDNHPQHGAECAEFNAKALAYVASDPSIEAVFVAGFWWAGDEPDPDQPGSFYAPGLDDDPPAALRLGLSNELAALRQTGKRVVVFADPPRYTFDTRRALLIDAVPGRAWLGAFTRGGSPIERGWVDSKYVFAPTVMDEAAKRAALENGVSYADLRRPLCETERCQVADAAGHPLYVDPHHLSAAGSLAVLTPEIINTQPFPR